MARITMPEGPTVAPQGYPTEYQHEEHFDAGPGLQKALGQFGELAKESGKYADKQIEVVQNQARATKVRNDVTDLETYGTDQTYGTQNPTPGEAADAAFDGRDSTQGYFTTRGQDAVAQGPEVFERIKKKRDDLAQTYTDPVAKKVFLDQSEQLLRGYYSKIETHSAQQREQAGIDALKAAEAQAQREAALNPTDDKAAQASIARIVGAQDHFTTSTQDAFEKATEVQAKVTRTRLDVLLAQPNGWGEAERILNANKGVLGDEVKTYEKLIAGAKNDSLAEVKAQEIVDSSMKDDVTVDEAAVFTKVDEMPAGKLKDETRQRVAQRLVVKKQLLEQRKDDVSKTALGLYNAGEAAGKGGWGSIPPAVKEQLNKYNPTLFHSLLNESNEKWRRLQGTKAEQNRAQREYDKQALQDYQLSGDDAAARTKQDLDAFLANYPGLSKEGGNAIRLRAQADKGVVDKGLAVNESKFNQQAKDAGVGFVKGGKKEQKEFQAEAGIAYSDWVRDHEGKAPNEQQVDKEILGPLVTKQIKKGILWDSTEYGYQKRKRRREEFQKAAVGATVLPELDLTDDTKKKPPYAVRVQQLKAAGKTKDEARVILKSEGY